MWTEEYRTKTIFLQQANPSDGKTWPMALDLGYGGIKTFGVNSISCIPSYIKKNDAVESITRFDDADIFYRDETGTYAIGNQAFSRTNPKESSSNMTGKYSRDRYTGGEYRIMANVGLGMMLNANKYGDPAGKELHVMTGLPPAYLKEDSYFVKEAIAGSHHFEIKHGARDWKEYHFVIPEERVGIMPQPMGTLVSIATDIKGNPVPHIKDLFSKKILIADGGYGTYDLFVVANKLLSEYDTLDNMGMYKVLTRLADLIEENYQNRLQINEIQDALRDGTFRLLDKKCRPPRCVAQDFSPLLAKASAEICDEVLNNIDQKYDFLSHFDYAAFTGGTNVAWKSQIEEHYKGISTLTLVNPSATSGLPAIFTNCRGYYFQLNAMLKNIAKRVAA